MTEDTTRRSTAGMPGPRLPGDAQRQEPAVEPERAADDHQQNRAHEQGAGSPDPGAAAGGEGGAVDGPSGQAAAATAPGTSVPRWVAWLAKKGHVETLPREQIATGHERKTADNNRLLADRYVRSYAVIRICVGFIGILLPIVLMIGESFVAGSVTARDSISAYYHSPMQDLFVAALSIIAFLLLTYMSGQVKTADFAISTLAGITLLGVVFFPTWRPGVEGTNGPFCGPGVEPPGCSAVESTLGESRTAIVHVTCATIFILSLAVICCCFAVRDRTKGRGAWRWITQLVCAAAIIVACLWVAMGPKIFGLTPLYVGEVAAVWAFGVSWFIAGHPIKLLLRKPLPTP